MNWVPWDDPRLLHQGFTTRVGRVRVRVYQDHTERDTLPNTKHFYGFIPDGPVLFRDSLVGDWDRAKAVALMGCANVPVQKETP